MFVRTLYHGPLVGGVGPGIQSSLLHRYLGRLLGIDKKIKVHQGDRRWEAVGYDTEICTATINTNQFYRYDDDRKREIRDKYGFSESQTVVLYVGKLTEYKGAHIVDEMARLARGDDSLHFLVVGVGPMEDRFHDRENIEYEGFVENDSMPDRYNLADVTVAPREDDNTSNVGLESIACGTPVITTATGDIEDLFRDSGTYVWADRSPEAVLETVNELVLDSTRYENQVKRGLNTIEERELTLDSALKTHLEVYRDLATASVDTKPNSKADASQ
jgi:glycosyltransferase involved in cell wall biosynthesis